MLKSIATSRQLKIAGKTLLRWLQHEQRRIISWVLIATFTFSMTGMPVLAVAMHDSPSESAVSVPASAPQSVVAPAPQRRSPFMSPQRHDQLDAILNPKPKPVAAPPAPRRPNPYMSPQRRDQIDAIVHPPAKPPAPVAPPAPPRLNPYMSAQRRDQIDAILHGEQVANVQAPRPNPYMSAQRHDQLDAIRNGEQAPPKPNPYMSAQRHDQIDAMRGEKPAPALSKEQAAAVASKPVYAQVNGTLFMGTAADIKAGNYQTVGTNLMSPDTAKSMGTNGEVAYVASYQNGQLVNASLSDGRTLAFANGNPASFTVTQRSSDGQRTAVSAYQEGQLQGTRLTLGNMGGLALEYDAKGNLTQDSARQLRAANGKGTVAVNGTGFTLTGADGTKESYTVAGRRVEAPGEPGSGSSSQPQILEQDSAQRVNLNFAKYGTSSGVQVSYTEITKQQTVTSASDGHTTRQVTSSNALGELQTVVTSVQGSNGSWAVQEAKGTAAGLVQGGYADKPLLDSLAVQGGQAAGLRNVTYNQGGMYTVDGQRNLLGTAGANGDVRVLAGYNAGTGRTEVRLATGSEAALKGIDIAGAEIDGAKAGQAGNGRTITYDQGGAYSVSFSVGADGKPAYSLMGSQTVSVDGKTETVSVVSGMSGGALHVQQASGSRDALQIAGFGTRELSRLALTGEGGAIDTANGRQEVQYEHNGTYTVSVSGEGASASYSLIGTLKDHPGVTVIAGMAGDHLEVAQRMGSVADLKAAGIAVPELNALPKNGNVQYDQNGTVTVSGNRDGYQVIGTIATDKGNVSVSSGLQDGKLTVQQASGSKDALLASGLSFNSDVLNAADKPLTYYENTGTACVEHQVPLDKNGVYTLALSNEDGKTVGRLTTTVSTPAGDLNFAYGIDKNGNPEIQTRGSGAALKATSTGAAGINSLEQDYTGKDGQRFNDSSTYTRITSQGEDGKSSTHIMATMQLGGGKPMAVVADAGGGIIALMQGDKTIAAANPANGRLTITVTGDQQDRLAIVNTSQHTDKEFDFQGHEQTGYLQGLRNAGNEFIAGLKDTWNAGIQHANQFWNSVDKHGLFSTDALGNAGRVFLDSAALVGKAISGSITAALSPVSGGFSKLGDAYKAIGEGFADWANKRDGFLGTLAKAVSVPVTAITAAFYTATKFIAENTTMIALLALAPLTGGASIAGLLGQAFFLGSLVSGLDQGLSGLKDTLHQFFVQPFTQLKDGAVGVYQTVTDGGGAFEIADQAVLLGTGAMSAFFTLTMLKPLGGVASAVKSGLDSVMLRGREVMWAMNGTGGPIAGIKAGLSALAHGLTVNVGLRSTMQAIVTSDLSPRQKASDISALVGKDSAKSEAVISKYSGGSRAASDVGAGSKASGGEVAAKPEAGGTQAKQVETLQNNVGKADVALGHATTVSQFMSRGENLAKATSMLAEGLQRVGDVKGAATVLTALDARDGAKVLTQMIRSDGGALSGKVLDAMRETGSKGDQLLGQAAASLGGDKAAVRAIMEKGSAEGGIKAAVINAALSGPKADAVIGNLGKSREAMSQAVQAADTATVGKLADIAGRMSESGDSARPMKQLLNAAVKDAEVMKIVVKAVTGGSPASGHAEARSAIMDLAGGSKDVREGLVRALGDNPAAMKDFVEQAAAKSAAGSTRPMMSTLLKGIADEPSAGKTFGDLLNNGKLSGDSKAKLEQAVATELKNHPQDAGPLLENINRGAGNEGSVLKRLQENMPTLLKQMSAGDVRKLSQSIKKIKTESGRAAVGDFFKGVAGEAAKDANGKEIGVRRNDEGLPQDKVMATSGGGGSSNNGGGQGNGGNNQAKGKKGKTDNNTETVNTAKKQALNGLQAVVQGRNQGDRVAQEPSGRGTKSEKPGQTNQKDPFQMRTARIVDAVTRQLAHPIRLVNNVLATVSGMKVINAEMRRIATRLHGEGAMPGARGSEAPAGEGQNWIQKAANKTVNGAARSLRVATGASVLEMAAKRIGDARSARTTSAEGIAKKLNAVETQLAALSEQAAARAERSQSPSGSASKYEQAMKTYDTHNARVSLLKSRAEGRAELGWEKYARAGARAEARAELRSSGQEAKAALAGLAKYGELIGKQAALVQAAQRYEKQIDEIKDSLARYNFGDFNQEMKRVPGDAAGQFAGKLDAANTAVRAYDAAVKTGDPVAGAQAALEVVQAHEALGKSAAALRQAAAKQAAEIRKTVIDPALDAVQKAAEASDALAAKQQELAAKIQAGREWPTPYKTKSELNKFNSQMRTAHAQMKKAEAALPSAQAASVHAQQRLLSMTDMLGQHEFVAKKLLQSSAHTEGLVAQLLERVPASAQAKLLEAAGNRAGELLRTLSAENRQMLGSELSRKTLLRLVDARITAGNEAYAQVEAARAQGDTQKVAGLEELGRQELQAAGDLLAGRSAKELVGSKGDGGWLQDPKYRRALETSQSSLAPSALALYGRKVVEKSVAKTAGEFHEFLNAQKGDMTVDDALAKFNEQRKAAKQPALEMNAEQLAELGKSDNAAGNDATADQLAKVGLGRMISKAKLALEMKYQDAQARQESLLTQINQAIARVDVAEWKQLQKQSGKVLVEVAQLEAKGAGRLATAPNTLETVKAADELRAGMELGIAITLHDIVEAKNFSEITKVKADGQKNIENAGKSGDSEAVKNATKIAEENLQQALAKAGFENEKQFMDAGSRTDYREALRQADVTEKIVDAWDGAYADIYKKAGPEGVAAYQKMMAEYSARIATALKTAPAKNAPALYEAFTRLRDEMINKEGLKPGSVEDARLVQAYGEAAFRAITGFTDLRFAQKAMLAEFFAGNNVGLRAGGGKTNPFIMFPGLTGILAGKAIRAEILVDDGAAITKYLKEPYATGFNQGDLARAFGRELVDGNKLYSEAQQSGNFREFIAAVRDPNRVLIFDHVTRAQLRNTEVNNAELRSALAEANLIGIDEVHMAATSQTTAIIGGKISRPDVALVRQVDRLLNELGYDFTASEPGKPVFAEGRGFEYVDMRGKIYDDVQKAKAVASSDKIILLTDKGIEVNQAARDALHTYAGGVIEATIRTLYSVKGKSGEYNAYAVEDGLIYPVDNLGGIQYNQISHDIVGQITAARINGLDPHSAVRVNETTMQTSLSAMYAGNQGARIVGASGTISGIESLMQSKIGSKSTHLSTSVLDLGRQVFGTEGEILTDLNATDKVVLDSLTKARRNAQVFESDPKAQKELVVTYMPTLIGKVKNPVISVISAEGSGYYVAKGRASAFIAERNAELKEAGKSIKDTKGIKDIFEQIESPVKEYDYVAVTEDGIQTVVEHAGSIKNQVVIFNEQGATGKNYQGEFTLVARNAQKLPADLLTQLLLRSGRPHGDTVWATTRYVHVDPVELFSTVETAVGRTAEIGSLKDGKALLDTLGKFNVDSLKEYNKLAQTENPTSADKIRLAKLGEELSPILQDGLKVAAEYKQLQLVGDSTRFAIQDTFRDRIVVNGLKEALHRTGMPPAARAIVESEMNRMLNNFSSNADLAMRLKSNTDPGKLNEQYVKDTFKSSVAEAQKAWRHILSASLRSPGSWFSGNIGEARGMLRQLKSAMKDADSGTIPETNTKSFAEAKSFQDLYAVGTNLMKDVLSRDNGGPGAGALQYQTSRVAAAVQAGTLSPERTTAFTQAWESAHQQLADNPTFKSGELTVAAAAALLHVDQNTARVALAPTLAQAIRTMQVNLIYGNQDQNQDQKQGLPASSRVRFTAAIATSTEEQPHDPAYIDAYRQMMAGHGITAGRNLPLVGALVRKLDAPVIAIRQSISQGLRALPGIAAALGKRDLQEIEIQRALLNYQSLPTRESRWGAVAEILAAEDAKPQTPALQALAALVERLGLASETEGAPQGLAEQAKAVLEAGQSRLADLVASAFRNSPAMAANVVAQVLKDPAASQELHAAIVKALGTLNVETWREQHPEQAQQALAAQATQQEEMMTQMKAMGIPEDKIAEMGVRQSEQDTLILAAGEATMLQITQGKPENMTLAVPEAVAKVMGSSNPESGDAEAGQAWLTRIADAMVSAQGQGDPEAGRVWLARSLINSKNPQFAELVVQAADREKDEQPLTAQPIRLGLTGQRSAKQSPLVIERVARAVATVMGQGWAENNPDTAKEVISAISDYYGSYGPSEWLDKAMTARVGADWRFLSGLTQERQRLNLATTLQRLPLVGSLAVKAKGAIIAAVDKMPIPEPLKQQFRKPGTMAVTMAAGIVGNIAFGPMGGMMASAAAMAGVKAGKLAAKGISALAAGSVRNLRILTQPARATALHAQMQKDLKNLQSIAEKDELTLAEITRLTKAIADLETRYGIGQTVAENQTTILGALDRPLQHLVGTGFTLGRVSKAGWARTAIITVAALSLAGHAVSGTMAHVAGNGVISITGRWLRGHSLIVSEQNRTKSEMQDTQAKGSESPVPSTLLAEWKQAMGESRNPGQAVSVLADLLGQDKHGQIQLAVGNTARHVGHMHAIAAALDLLEQGGVDLKTIFAGQVLSIADAAQKNAFITIAKSTAGFFSGDRMRDLLLTRAGEQLLAKHNGLITELGFLPMFQTTALNKKPDRWAGEFVKNYILHGDELRDTREKLNAAQEAQFKPVYDAVRTLFNGKEYFDKDLTELSLAVLQMQADGGEEMRTADAQMQAEIDAAKTSAERAGLVAAKDTEFRTRFGDDIGRDAYHQMNRVPMVMRFMSKKTLQAAQRQAEPLYVVRKAALRRIALGAATVGATAIGLAAALAVAPVAGAIAGVAAIAGMAGALAAIGTGSMMLVQSDKIAWRLNPAGYVQDKLDQGRFSPDITAKLLQNENFVIARKSMNVPGIGNQLVSEHSRSLAVRMALNYLIGVVQNDQVTEPDKIARTQEVMAVLKALQFNFKEEVTAGQQSTDGKLRIQLTPVSQPPQTLVTDPLINRLLGTLRKQNINFDIPEKWQAPKSPKIKSSDSAA